MASKGSGTQPSRPRLSPTCARDKLGTYIKVTCGKLSGQLYLDKLARKPPGKCVYVDGQWYTPSEVESLGGKKARKWRQSLFHMGKPLVDYDLTCVEQSGVGDTLPRNNDVDTPPCSVQLPSVHQGLPSVSPRSHSGPPSQQGPATVESSQEPGLATAASASTVPSCSGCSGENAGLLLDAVLSFIKAYRLKGDNDSLRLVVTERFSPKEVETSKRRLWDHCSSVLEANGLVFHARRDSDRRSQILANLDDIIQFFNILDSVGRIPPLYCEASDLLRLPPLSLDPVAEQVSCNSQSLKHLAGLVECLDNRLSSFLDSNTTLSGTRVQQSYSAVAASSVSLPEVSSPALLSTQKSVTSRPPISDNRESNLILFGVPEEGSIVEAKRTVDEVFEFLSGKQVQIKDIFRLGRFKRSQSSSSRPRPLLIKLCTAWDRKLILLRKTKLREFRIKRLFLREDVAPDHKLRQRQSDPSSKSNAPSSAPDAAPIPASSRSATPVPHLGPSVDVCVASKVFDPVSTLSLSASPPATSSASLLGGRGKHSVSSSFPASEQGPPPAAPECLIVTHSLSPSGTRSRSASPSSASSSSTIVTGSVENEDGSS